MSNPCKIEYTRPEYESFSPLVNILGNILIAESSLTVDDWVSKIIPIVGIEKEQEEIGLPERLTNPNYGSAGLDAYLQEATANIISIEEVRKITDKLPSLTKILLDIRHDEQ